ncbi:hypothetical protein AK812_SmicGene43540 [Symbiodinium microadriaticum]|uniref:J domain-containing protein n=1 Tax=Symbiodinium microadriaticum TaxID=2951 RepID=A0A1Q9C0R3_SYMMI|nr:hypothetical protein AK812_SmicGene43540 [Symbiodinium microadriaticum]
MNPLCPPEDAIFERVQNCIQRGKGMKLGDTIIARVRDDVPFGLNWLPDSLLPLPRKKEKAKILQVFQKHLEVRYKRSGITDTIPKSWGELLSQSVRQRQAAGYEPAVWQSETRAAKCGTWRSEVPSVVKFPQASSSSTAMGMRCKNFGINGKAVNMLVEREQNVTLNLQLPSAVDVSKVRAQSLIRHKPEEENRTFRGKYLRSCLQTITEASHRGFNGSLALREIRAEWKRRQGIQQQQAELEQYRAHHNLPPSDLPKPPNDSDSSEEEDEAVSDAEQEDPWEVEEEATSQDTSTEEDFPKAAPKPVPRASCGSAPRNIATPVANAVRRSVAAPVRLQGHMVPCYEQLESTETSFSPKGSEIEEARRLLGVASDASLADLNRTRRRLALQKHPDKAMPSLRSYAHKEWLKIDAAYKTLKIVLERS